MLPVPAEERGKSPCKREGPDSEYAQKCPVVGHGFGSDTLHNDIVAVESNHCHGPYRSTSE